MSEYKFNWVLQNVEYDVISKMLGYLVVLGVGIFHGAGKMKCQNEFSHYNCHDKAK